MALHLGNSEELKIYINGVRYKLNLYSEKLITNGDILLSSDNFILQDVNGLYLTVQSNNLYLTTKESD